jgi:diguanylate cyclase (GGDEF)-like protein
LKTTVKELKKRISFTDSLAYHDSLTGLNNLTAYTRDKERLKQRFENEACDYAVFIIDINGLKMVNDTFGHRVGNDLIIESGKAIGSTFGYENVYRIGGDEFVAIIRGATEESCKMLKDNLLRVLSESEGKIIPALAIGYYICRESKIEYERVFELADEAMYSEKIKLKANGITSRVIK